MQSIYAYHITDISNLKSLVQNGLIPRIGKNSRLVHEHYHLTYFTTFDCIKVWINRFHLDKNKIVILKFLCTDYERRYDDANDYITEESYSPKDIVVVGKEETSLEEYYLQNKELIDLELNKSIINYIKIITERLEKIENASLSAETSWNYTETEPNIVDTIDLLIKIRCLDDKTEYRDIINAIMEKTLKKLKENNLNITKDCELYKSLEYIFIDCMSDKPKIDIRCLNYVIQILSINLYYRQLDRYNRTLKKIGEDNKIWQFDNLPLKKIESILSNSIFNLLLDETLFLHEQYYNSKKK